MRVISWKTLQKLGRIPRSDDCLRDGFTVSVDSLIDMDNAEIWFFSHRWSRPLETLPDDAANSKAEALVKIGSNYSLSWQKELYYWIDFACVDQSCPLPGIEMLPLYVALCDDFCCYCTPDYEMRAWTRLERWLRVSVTGDPSLGVLASANISAVDVTDPVAGGITVKDDMQHVSRLTELGKQIYEKNSKALLSFPIPVTNKSLNSLELQQSSSRIE